jgi:hypothetical protein
MRDDPLSPPRGGDFSQNRHTLTGDFALYKRAFDELWPISPKTRAAILKRLEKIVADPKTKVRTFVRASALIMAASRVDARLFTPLLTTRLRDAFAERIATLEWVNAERLDHE